MIEISAWIIPIAWFSLVIGIAIALASWIAYDKRKEKRLRKMILESDSWCWANCRRLESCYGKHKDPDEAWKELQDYCSECPLARSIELMHREGEIK